MCIVFDAYGGGLVLLFLKFTVLLLKTFVTLHHEMSRNVPTGHFYVFIFSESKFYAIYNDENHFQIRELVVHVFEYGGMIFGTFGETCYKC